MELILSVDVFKLSSMSSILPPPVSFDICCNSAYNCLALCKSSFEFVWGWDLLVGMEYDTDSSSVSLSVSRSWGGKLLSPEFWRVSENLFLSCLAFKSRCPVDEPVVSGSDTLSASMSAIDGIPSPKI